MKTTFFTCLLLLFFGYQLFAQKKEVVVSGKSELLMEDSYCFGEIKRRAEDLAKLAALEDAFGKVIVQGTNTYIENKNTGEKVQTSTKFNTIANSLVRGEWLKTEKIETKWILRDKGVGRDKTQELWLICTIEGVAREIEEQKVDFTAFTLRCPDAITCKSSTFKNNESMFLSFRSPVEGYLSVFMEEGGTVYRLFPYTNMGGQYASYAPIEADKEYVLFSEKFASQFKDVSRYSVDEYQLATNEEQTFNRIYVIFGKQTFDKPILETKDGLKVLSPAKFQEWVTRNKSNNRNFQVSAIDITISK